MKSKVSHCCGAPVMKSPEFESFICSSCVNMCHAEKADAVIPVLRAERDALRAQVEAHAHDLGSLRSAVHDALPLDYPDGLLIKQVSVMGAELVRLRRQVEAARALCRDRLDYGEGDTDLAQDILDAMGDIGYK